MNTATHSRTMQAPQRVNDTFEAAYDLTLDHGVTSVHVTVEQRLTYDELLQFRHRAAARDLSFVVTKLNGALEFLLHRRPSEGAI